MAKKEETYNEAIEKLRKIVAENKTYITINTIQTKLL